MRSQRRDKDADAELYSTSLLEQLLDSSKEWQDVEEIVPLTFKAVVDMLATHSQALKDIKSVLTTRASKTELATGLALKSNVSDVGKAVDELSQALEERPTFTEMSSTLREFATKIDLSNLMAITETARNMGRSLQEKENMELTILKTRMDEFQREIIKKVSTCATLAEFNQLTNILESKANTTEINQVLEQKVTKQYLSSALQKKANKADVEALLMKKSDAADIEYIVNSLESKVSVTTLDKLTQVLDNKVDKSELTMLNNERNMHGRSQLRQQEEELFEKLQHIKNTFAIEMKELRKEMALEIKENQSLLQIFKKEGEVEMRKYMAQVDSELVKKQSKLKLETSEEMDGIRQVLRVLQDDSNNKAKALLSLTGEISTLKRGEENIYSQIDEVRKKLEEGLCKAVEKKEFIDFKSQFTEMIENKVELDEVQGALDKFQATINVRLAADRTEQLQEIRTVKDLIIASSQTSASEMQQLRRSLTKKQEKDPLSWDQLLRKMRKEIEECRKTVDLVYCQVQGRISVKQYETDLIQIRKRFESLAKEVGVKANIKDVCVLSDSKPNIDDVNNALREINEALAERVTEADLQTVLKDQATINETLCSENIVGRWMWHSGDLKPGSLIPWESESANTVPDHFFWQKDKTSILIIAPGVYEITAGVFSKRGLVNIMANGELTNQYRTENQNTLNVNNQKKKKEKGTGSTSITEYLLLPSRSRLSVVSGGEGCEGFLNIRRL